MLSKSKIQKNPLSFIVLPPLSAVKLLQPMDKKLIPVVFLTIRKSAFDLFFEYIFNPNDSSHRKLKRSFKEIGNGTQVNLFQYFTIYASYHLINRIGIKYNTVLDLFSGTKSIIVCSSLMFTMAQVPFLALPEYRKKKDTKEVVKSIGKALAVNSCFAIGFGSSVQLMIGPLMKYIPDNKNLQLIMMCGMERMATFIGSAVSAPLRIYFKGEKCNAKSILSQKRYLFPNEF